MTTLIPLKSDNPLDEDNVIATCGMVLVMLTKQYGEDEPKVVELKQLYDGLVARRVARACEGTVK